MLDQRHSMTDRIVSSSWAVGVAAAFVVCTSTSALADHHGELYKPPKGFQALFNGKDLAGWFGHGTEDPRKLWMMTPEELAAHQAKTLEDVNAHWSVKNGILVNDGQGLYLTTKRNFGDFELMLEYKTVAKADSGIYPRGVPQVQIWDSTGSQIQIGRRQGFRRTVEQLEGYSWQGSIEAHGQAIWRMESVSHPDDW